MAASPVLFSPLGTGAAGPTHLFLPDLNDSDAQNIAAHMVHPLAGSFAAPYIGQPVEIYIQHGVWSSQYGVMATLVARIQATITAFIDYPQYGIHFAMLAINPGADTWLRCHAKTSSYLDRYAGTGYTAGPMILNASALSIPAVGGTLYIDFGSPATPLGCALTAAVDFADAAYWPEWAAGSDWDIGWGFGSFVYPEGPFPAQYWTGAGTTAPVAGDLQGARTTNVTLLATLPDPASETSSATAPMYVRVRTAGPGPTAALAVNVGGGPARARLNLNVFAIGSAVAPLYVVKPLIAQSHVFDFNGAGDSSLPRVKGVYGGLDDMRLLLQPDGEETIQHWWVSGEYGDPYVGQMVTIYVQMPIHQYTFPEGNYSSQPVTLPPPYWTYEAMVRCRIEGNLNGVPNMVVVAGHPVNYAHIKNAGGQTIMSLYSRWGGVYTSEGTMGSSGGTQVDLDGSATWADPAYFPDFANVPPHRVLGLHFYSPPVGGGIRLVGWQPLDGSRMSIEAALHSLTLVPVLGELNPRSRIDIHNSDLWGWDTWGGWGPPTMPGGIPPSGGTPSPATWPTGDCAARAALVVNVVAVPVRAAIMCRVGQTGRASVVLLVSTAGDPDVPPGVSPSSWWTHAVRLGGIDVTDRLLGEVTVEAEAGAARIATFRLGPTGAPLDLGALGDATVEIDYLAPGSVTPARLFTGRVADPAFDLNTGVLTCTASDGRTARLDAMDPEAIAAITPGAAFAAAVQGADLAGAKLADARMTTLAADLDLSPMGAWRLSPWAAAATPTRTYTRVVEDSVSVQLLRYADVVNRVEVAFQYRYPVLADRAVRIDWAYGGASHPWWVPRAMLTEATEKDGWRVESADWTPAAGDGHLTSATLTARRRHVQTVTEDYALTLRAPLSEDAHGARQVGRREASLSVDYDDAAWVDDPTRAPLLAASPSINAAQEPRHPATDQASDGRAVVNAALATLLAQARVDILASLRGSRITAVVPCDAAIDLPNTLRIAAGRVTVQARVIRLIHTLSGDDGRATTEFTLAAFATPGSNPAETPLAAPAPPTHPAPDVSSGGSILNSVISQAEPNWDQPGLRLWYSVSTETESYTQFGQTLEHDVTVLSAIKSQFGVDLPEIPEVDTQPLTLPLTAEYLVAVPIDPLTLIA